MNFTNNSRRGKTQTQQAVIKQSIIPELVSGSSTQAVTKQQALKTLKKFQGLSYFTTARGFTLIELLVVVLIIGILAAVAVPQYQVAVLKSRYVQLMVSLHPIEQAIKSYYLANGEYPTKFDELDVHLHGEQTTNKTITNGDYVCILYDGKSGMAASIYCKYNSNDNMIAYRWLFDRIVKQCETTKTWKVGVQVCQNICGNNGYTTSQDSRLICFLNS